MLCVLKKQWFCFWRCLAADRRLRLELSLGLGLVLALVLTARCSSFARTASAVRADTLRLHVQAAGNSPADQLTKLRVRDAVLAQAARMFAPCPDQQAAVKTAQAGLAPLELAARRALGQAGQSCPVRVFLTRMDFATTHYREFTLPAGPYDAMRVELGPARGRNWFCVLYPGLCIPAAQRRAPAAYPARGEQRLVTEGYRLQFALLEAWQRLMPPKE